MTSLRLIGYWNGEHALGWREVSDFVDPDWNEQERHLVSQYVAAGTVARTFMGRSVCRFCGIANGSVEYSDGTYIWPSGLGHYIDEHHVRVPLAFVEHAAARLGELESAEVDDSWWRGTKAD